MNIPQKRWQEAIASLRAAVLRRGVPDAEADDVVQMALERALRRLDQLEDVDRLEQWLHRIARNPSIDVLRSRLRRPPFAELDEDIVAAHDSEPDALLSYADCILLFLERLPPADAEAIALKDISGRSFTDVASHMSIGVPGAKSRVQRARCRLRGALMACCGEMIEQAPFGHCGRLCRAEARP